MAVLAEHRPTLREQLARRPRARRAAWVCAALVVVFAAWLGWHVLHPGVGVSGSRPFAYHLRRPAALRVLPPGPGEMVRLEQRRHGRIVNEFVVSPLRLPPYTGDPEGALAIVAAHEAAALRARFPGVQIGAEGVQKLAGMPGHELRFRIPGRPRLYGREMLLPRPQPGARDGVVIVAIAAASADVGGAGDIGVHGTTRLPYRTFRFG